MPARLPILKMELCLGTPTLNSQQDTAAELALVERCRRQDADAFGRIIDAYQHRIFGFVKRMIPDVEEASDVAQEVFIRAYQGLSRFDGRSSLRTWLFRIAYNLCVDRARKASRTPSETRIESNEEDELAHEFADSRWNPEEIIINEELMSIVEEGIEGMSEKLRTVLLLHDREDLAYEEIANALELPIGTVKSRLFLARAHLQGVLGEYLRGRQQP